MVHRVSSIARILLLGGAATVSLPPGAQAQTISCATPDCIAASSGGLDGPSRRSGRPGGVSPEAAQTASLSAGANLQTTASERASTVEAGAGPVAARGQDASEEDVIIVTAQKRSERLSDVPLSVTAVSGERLAELGISSPADLEKVAPGFAYRPSAQGSPIFQIRGIGFFEESIGISPTVGVYLDQAPLPFSVMAEGVAFDLERVEVLKGPQGTLFGQNVTGGAINYIAAKPTDTVRAGVDATYGRFDDAGLGGFISGPLTSKLTARVAARIERRSDWQRTYTRVNEAGLYVTDTDAPYRTLGDRRFEVGRILLDWKPSDTVEFLLNANGWKNHSETQAQQFVVTAPDTPENIGSVPFWPQFESFPRAPNNSRYADWDPQRSFRRDDRFFQVSLNGRVRFDERTDLTSITAYSDIDVARPVDNDGTPFPSVPILSRGRLKSFSQEVRLSGSFPMGLRLMAGGNYAKDDTRELQEIGLNVTNTLPLFDGAVQDMSGEAETWGAFGSVDYELTGTLTAQGAVRYTKQERSMAGCTRDPGNGGFGNFVSLVFQTPPIPPGGCITLDPATFQAGIVRDSFTEDNVAWRLGLDWKPAPDIMLYANATKGYKAGNFVNISALFSNSLEPVPQESVQSLEAGFKVSLLDRRLQLNGAAFFYDYKNKQLVGFRDSGVIGVLNSVVSIPESRVSGAEIEALVRPLAGLTLRGGATYIDSEVTGDFLALDSAGNINNRKGESFPGTPKWAAIADAEYEVALSPALNGFLGANLSYRSESRTYFGGDPNYRIEGYTLIDARLGVGTRDDRYRLHIYGRNIFNKFYVLTAQGQGDNVTRIAGTPATYGLAFTARY